MHREGLTAAEHVRAEFGEQVDAVLDGGPCRAWVESTIAGFSRRSLPALATAQK